MNPAHSTPNAKHARKSMAKLDWLVVADWFQTETSLFWAAPDMKAEDVKKVVIAYEPIWAIGTGKTASAAQAEEVCAIIRKKLAALYDAATAEDVSILYGGSVKGGNVAELTGSADIDGGLVGGASLKADDFLAVFMRQRLLLYLPTFVTIKSMRGRRNSMKYILYVLSFFCLLIGGGAWFFYNHPVGVIGVILSLYILYRLERQPHKLSLKWPGSKGKGASRDQAAFEKALSDFNRMEAERRGLTDSDLCRTVANMQHIARNFLYYLQQYPERIGLAEHFIDYYQDRAVFMVRKYKKLSATGLRTDKVVQTQQKLKTLLSQLDQAYEEPIVPERFPGPVETESCRPLRCLYRRNLFVDYAGTAP